MYTWAIHPRKKNCHILANSSSTNKSFGIACCCFYFYYLFCSLLSSHDVSFKRSDLCIKTFFFFCKPRHVLCVYMLSPGSLASTWGENTQWQKTALLLAETRMGSRGGREISAHHRFQHFPPQTSCLRSGSPISVITGPWQANDKQTNMCAK